MCEFICTIFHFIYRISCTISLFEIDFSKNICLCSHSLFLSISIPVIHIIFLRLKTWRRTYAEGGFFVCYLYNLHSFCHAVVNLLTFARFQCDNYITFTSIYSCALQMPPFEKLITSFQTYHLLQSFL